MYTSLEPLTHSTGNLKGITNNIMLNLTYFICLKFSTALMQRHNFQPMPHHPILDSVSQLQSKGKISQCLENEYGWRDDWQVRKKLTSRYLSCPLYFPFHSWDNFAAASIIRTHTECKAVILCMDYIVKKNKKQK